MNNLSSIPVMYRMDVVRSVENQIEVLERWVDEGILEVTSEPGYYGMFDCDLLHSRAAWMFKHPVATGVANILPVQVLSTKANDYLLHLLDVAKVLGFNPDGVFPYTGYMLLDTPVIHAVKVKLSVVRIL